MSIRNNPDNNLHETHEVFNQPTPLENYNAYDSDLVLQHWTSQYGGDPLSPRIRNYGQHVGHELIEAGFLANKYKPEFESHNRSGERIDLVNFHPSYHQLMRTAITAGLHNLPWLEPGVGAHVARGAMNYLHQQIESGSGCPLTMTFASIPSIKLAPEIAEHWLPKILSPHYDERNIPWFDKQGLTIGMAMTEKQGGSDVRANTTTARFVGSTSNGQEYEITGHKWFCSAPMSDAFLVLAQTGNGLSCFLMPRWRPDGSKNAFLIQRLKDKLGNRSNASSEVEFRNAYAQMIGEEGKGVRTIIEMVAMTRFDCMIGSSALMRAGVAQATHHAKSRSVFGKNLFDQPLMQNVLADLAIESEAALAMSMRVASALDLAATDSQQQLFARLALAVGKYWICKRTPQHAYEAMECLGGSGYVEENVMPRVYREAPVNAIWEGSGNVQCLDLIRALGKEPAVIDAFLEEVMLAQGLDATFDDYIHQLKNQFVDASTLEFRARGVMEKMALALQGSLLLRHSDQNVAQAFIASRLAGQGGYQYGTLGKEINCKAIIERACPQDKI